MRIPDIHKDVRMEHERRKCGMECSSNLASNVRLQKGDSSKLSKPEDVQFKKGDGEWKCIAVMRDCYVWISNLR